MRGKVMRAKASMDKCVHRFSEEERRGLYRAIYERRDVRSFFEPDDGTGRCARAPARRGPPRPFSRAMQPWRFIVVRDREVRQTVYEIFDRASRAAAQIYKDDRRALYETLKLAGILEAPSNLCVTCDEATVRGHGLGRQTMRETALYSTVCAVQNLWLAAQAEGVGVGWVSILDVDELRTALGIPEDCHAPRLSLCGLRHGVWHRARPGNQRLGAPRAARGSDSLRSLWRSWRSPRRRVAAFHQQETTSRE